MRYILPLLLLAATPAAAQIWDGGYPASRPGLRQFDPDSVTQRREVRRIDRSIRDGVRRGELTRREARDLRAQANAIGRSTTGPGMVLNLKGLVDAKRAQGRAANAARGK